MVTVRPARRAWVPRDGEAARRLSAPNYDEFQDDDEVRAILRARPDSMLRVTMPHCDGPGAEEGSPGALDRAAANLEALRPLCRPVRDALWVYEVEGHQIGLGGMAPTSEIGRTVIRNEGIRETKARGRADLIARTRTFVDAVNLAVEDGSGRLAAALRAAADARRCDFAAEDERGRRHRVWLLDDPGPFVALLAAEPVAYVADGNHRSAAAAMLGCPEYVGVFFPLEQMRILPYNRLVRAPLDIAALGASFDVAPADASPYQPARTHDIGLYHGGGWRRLRPRRGTFDGSDAAASIDADIVQRLVFAALCGIADARDARLAYVGGDRGAACLAARVDRGEFDFAVTLAPVTLRQFADVCRQRRMMPPKSTWFDPKLRTGMVLAEVDS